MSTNDVLRTRAAMEAQELTHECRRGLAPDAGRVEEVVTALLEAFGYEPYASDEDCAECRAAGHVPPQEEMK